MIATCPERETLRGYANGVVPEDQAEELTVHLRDCQSCQQWLAETEDLDDTLVGQLQSSTRDGSFELEPDCQSAMARALGALAVDGDLQDDDVSLPSSIGDYEIVRRIGRGGMGNVYLAQHTRLDRTVAVKVLASHRLSDPRMHERFEKEMKAIGSLSHPNIVAAHDARDVDGVALLVTEWIDGLNLKDVVDRVGPLQVADACEIGVRLADALEYVCSESLIHRDLKPSNVMISRDGEVKLLDLGLARLRSGEADPDRDATATGQAMGTADYVAPEQINDARAVDIRADIYSLGCTLYKLLAGRAPFESGRYPTTFAKLTAHVSDEPAPLRTVAPHVPPVVSDLVGQMLAKSPDDRPESLDGIKLKLQAQISGSDLQALIQMALSAGQAKRSAGSDEAPVQPVSRGFWDRRVPIATAIAAGLGGLFAGWLLGVMITITHPDGSKTQVEVPRGSQSTVDPSGNLHIKLGSTQAPANAAEAQAGASEAAAIPPEALQPPDDTARFDGVWQIESAMYRGRNAPLQSIENGALAFHEHGFAFMQRSRPALAGSWKLDSDLGRITLDGVDADQQENRVNKGLYRFVADDKLMLCIASEDNDDFPEMFESPRVSGLSTLTLQRVEMPLDRVSMQAFVQDPAKRALVHAVAMYGSIKSGADPVAILRTARLGEAAIQKTNTRRNLKQLGIAFHNFHDAHSVFPASSGGRFGNKLAAGDYPCSWRVALLPFIEQASLFEQYRFDEPWDSEHNLQLLDQMPQVYRRPDAPEDSTTTGYVGFVGNNTALGDGESVRIRDMIDGTSNTLLLFEAETEIPWTKPEDIPLDEISKLGLLNEGPIQTLSADGAVKEFRPSSEQEIRQAAIFNDRQ